MKEEAARRSQNDEKSEESRPPKIIQPADIATYLYVELTEKLKAAGQQLGWSQDRFVAESLKTVQQPLAQTQAT